jgi:hypothetical protein
MEMGQSGADQNPASRHFKGGAASGNALQFGHGRSSETGKELRTSAPFPSFASGIGANLRKDASECPELASPFVV